MYFIQLFTSLVTFYKQFSCSILAFPLNANDCLENSYFINLNYNILVPVFKLENDQ